MKVFVTTVILLALSDVCLAKNSIRGKEQNDFSSILEEIENESDRFLGNVFAASQIDEDDNDDNTQYVIKFRSKEAMVRSQAGPRGKNVVMTMENFDMEVVNIETKNELKEWNADEDVLSIEKDQIRYLFDSVKREVQAGEETPYGIDLVKALDVTDANVAKMKVCIIDTGYDINHPDLPSGSNVSGDNNRSNRWDRDGNGHGTHVAGTIAAIGGNGIGVKGVNRNGEVRIHINRIFGDNGRPIFGSTIMAAVNACVNAGSNIISMSLGGPVRMALEEETFERAYRENNVLSIAAAGNSGNRAYSYPASYSSVMSVAAVNRNKALASFSQRNDQVDIAAPGVNVLSTKANTEGYIAYSGTSMACPHVAGVAALVWSNFPTKSAIEMRQVLKQSADDLGDPGRDDSFGYGLVRADRAYQYLNEGFTSSPTLSPTPERECFDYDGFLNSRNDGCNWYSGGVFNRCNWFGDSLANADRVTGNDACCVCGGGSFDSIPTDPSAAPVSTTSPTSNPTVSTEPTSSPTDSPSVCEDVDGWVNSFGNDCGWYGFLRCGFFGDSFENDGLVASEACCACK